MVVEMFRESQPRTCTFALTLPGAAGCRKLSSHGRHGISRAAHAVLTTSEELRAANERMENRRTVSTQHQYYVTRTRGCSQ